LVIASPLLSSETTDEGGERIRRDAGAGAIVTKPTKLALTRGA
jgi:hypothetical protein